MLSQSLIGGSVLLREEARTLYRELRNKCWESVSGSEPGCFMLCSGECGCPLSESTFLGLWVHSRYQGMQWSAEEYLLFLFLKPPRLGSPDSHRSAQTQEGRGNFWSLAEGPALVSVGAPLWPIRPLVYLIASDWLQLNSAKAIICP